MEVLVLKRLNVLYEMYCRGPYDRYVGGNNEEGPWTRRHCHTKNSTVQFSEGYTSIFRVFEMIIIMKKMNVMYYCKSVFNHV